MCNEIKNNHQQKTLNLIVSESFQLRQLRVKCFPKCKTGCKSAIFEHLKAAVKSCLQASLCMCESSVIDCDYHHLLTGDYNMEALHD
ncbi:uncharacterized protein V6R79_001817 [Siganus canaliculatus]